MRRRDATVPCVADDDGADLQQFQADGADLGAGHVGGLESVEDADREGLLTLERNVNDPHARLRRCIGHRLRRQSLQLGLGVEHCRIRVLAGYEGRETGGTVRGFPNLQFSHAVTRHRFPPSRPIPAVCPESTGNICYKKYGGRPHCARVHVTPTNFPVCDPDRAVSTRIWRYAFRFAARSAVVDMDGASAVGHHGEPESCGGKGIPPGAGDGGGRFC